jgi:hypothetical protein
MECRPERMFVTRKFQTKGDVEEEGEEDGERNSGNEEKRVSSLKLNETEWDERIG